jgi:uridine kinase
VRLVCIDGPAGAGKTALAQALAAELGVGAVVFHLDDLYEGWTGLDGVWDRLEGQVLQPLAQGRAGRWRRYDWELERFADWHDLPVPQVLVVEGCGSAQRAVDGRAALIVWVNAPAEVRLARGLARDGEGMREHWLRWMDSEQAHFARERTHERADARVDGTAALPD